MILKAKNIHKKFYHPQEVHILKGISLEINPGEAVAIVGASGEGKSTLLAILGTLDTYTEGFLEIAGNDVAKSNCNKLRNGVLGFIFQHFFLLEDYTALENVLMPARIARKPALHSYGEELLQWVGLGNRTHFPAKLLSGGEKQRVAIARALCNNPDLILADEPSGNLDHKTSQEIYEVLLRCTKDKGKSLLVVTHDLEFAHQCDRMLSLTDGLLSEVYSQAKTDS